LRALEFDRIRQGLAALARSAGGRRRCLELKPMADPQLQLELLQEYLELDRTLPWDGDEPVEELKRASLPGLVLEAKELVRLRGFMECCGAVRQELQRGGPCLQELGAWIQPLDELRQELQRALTPDGQVRDEASPQLRGLRRRMHHLRARLREHLEGILQARSELFQDQYITVRSGRYVLPVRADRRAELPGVVHDWSQSEATCFLEPLSAVEMGNALCLAEGEAREAERRVLAELSERVRSALASLEENLEVLRSLDLLQAKATMARRLRAVRPYLQGRSIRLLGVRNPLLADPVPVDLILPEGRRILLISGSNGGGKTAALKSLGLSAVLAYCGCFVPAKRAELPELRFLFAEIGQRQELASSLSAFCFQLARVRQALEGVRPGALILLDEPASGTDPLEGAALAQALLEEFQRRGAWVVVSTHLMRLKVYALACPEVEPAAVILEEGRPTYRIHYGRCGTSQALRAAQAMGLPPSVMAEARALLGAEHEALEVLERERQRLQELSEQLEVQKERLRRLFEQMCVQRQELLERFGQRLEEELRRALFEERRASGSGLRRRLRSLKETILPGASCASSISEGQRVWVRSLRREGVVTSLDADRGEAEVVLGSLRVHLPLEDLEEARTPPPPPLEHRPSPRASQLLDLRGMRTEEALEILDRALDAALLQGLGRLQVLHGVGTGRLERAVETFLRSNPRVRAFHRERPGLTVAEL